MKMRTLLLGFWILFLPGLLKAEQSESFGNYTVHYSTFTTDVLSADVAKKYNIKRSKNRALVNISILKKVMGTSVKSVKAKVKGSATNLTQQLRELNFREVVEETAVYYLAEVNISNDETLKFDLSVLPGDEVEPYELSFQQSFYTN